MAYRYTSFRLLYSGCPLMETKLDACVDSGSDCWTSHVVLICWSGHLDCLLSASNPRRSVRDFPGFACSSRTLFRSYIVYHELLEEILPWVVGAKKGAKWAGGRKKISAHFCSEWVQWGILVFDRVCTPYSWRVTLYSLLFFSPLIDSVLMKSLNITETAYCLKQKPLNLTPRLLIANFLFFLSSFFFGTW